MIYYAITPTFVNITRYCKEGRSDLVYDRIMFITDNHQAAEEASSWCENALVGETYEHEQFTIEIIEDED